MPGTKYEGRKVENRKYGEREATKDLKPERKIGPQCKHCNVDAKKVRVFECLIIPESERQFVW
jgi:hypothetical protein